MSELRAQKNAAAIEKLGRALMEIGFAILVNHNIQPGLLAAAYQFAAELFAHGEKALSRYSPEKGEAVGYTAFGREKAVGSEVADLKEFYHVRSAGNIWPTELVPQFEPVMARLFHVLFRLAKELADPINTFLGYEKGKISGMLSEARSLLRIIHYPPLGPNAPEGAVRAKDHGDINPETLLPAATEGGLEVKTIDNLWVPVDEQPESIILNMGDAMERLTKGREKRVVSTRHRVVNPVGAKAGVSRYAFPLFGHFAREAILDEETGLTAGQDFDERLADIGFGK